MTTERDFVGNVRTLSHNRAVGPEGEPISENEFRFNLLGQYHKLSAFDRREIGQLYPELPKSLLTALESYDYDIYRRSFLGGSVDHMPHGTLPPGLPGVPRQTLPPGLDLPPRPGARPYVLEDLDRMDRELNEWIRSRQAAPSGSTEERFASEQMDRVASRLESSAQDPNQFRGCHVVDVEAEADRFFDQYRKAPAGSRAEAIAQSVALALYDRCADVLQSELRYDTNFRNAEAIGERYNETCRRAPSGSIKESSARTLMNIALPAAEEELRRAVYAMGPRQRMELVSEYDAKWHAAASGSPLESHYDRMKAIAAD